MQEDLLSLRSDLAELRGDFEFLQAEVTRLRRLVVGIQASNTGGSRAAVSQPSGLESEASYSAVDFASEHSALVVSGPGQAFEFVGPEQASDLPGPEQARGVLGPVRAPYSGPVQASGVSGPVQAPLPPQGRDPISWEERDQIARGIGAWIRRCLDGIPRQSSGRDRIPLQSRYWVVVKSITGEVHNPPLVFNCWYRAKGLVKRGSQTGDSIFFGVPSQREASTAILAAGLQWTDHLQ